MDKQNAKEIFNKLKTGSITENEQQQLEDWMLGYRSTELSGLSEKELKSASKRIWQNISTRLGPLGSTIPLWRRVAAVASIVIVIAAGGFYFYQKNQTITTEITAKNDIAPGGNKAFLTLANGKRITLTDAKIGELAEQSGVKITKAADGQLIYTVSNLSKENNKINAYNTIETPRGGTYQVRLPDGTKVWLNAASTLKYPVSFTPSQARRVTLLSGEAYFEVAKDKKHPFIVQNEKQEVKVLGTHFNINSYADEGSVKTTLLEGSVKVSSLLANRDLQEQDHNLHSVVILKPDEQSIITSNNFIKVERVDVTRIIAWKNGMFQFEKATLKTIMSQLQHWYDVDVKYENNLTNVHYTGIVPRKSNISEVLKMLEETGPARFKVSGRTVIIMK